MWLGRSYGGATRNPPTPYPKAVPVASCIIYVVSGDVLFTWSGDVVILFKKNIFLFINILK
jgi:hypothetical protein